MPLTLDVAAGPAGARRHLVCHPNPRGKPASDVTDDRSRLPTFLVIGAMKGGTTSLHRHLRLHPEIGVAAEKEPHFFSKPEVHARGLGWYARQFPTGRPCRGEASATYAKRHLHPGTAERIRDALPNVKLIYLVRDPVERAISHYLHERRQRRERRPLEQALTEPGENNYLLTSRYMTQLDAYLVRLAETGEKPR